ncbi:MAG: hypothetical protein J6X00_02385 [Clostridia bacterium]|nr:hypothetical protein [Clostridia bacterium]
MMEGILVFVSGSSGAGKNSVINGVIDKNPRKCKFLVSNTTREKRASDKKKGQYHFISKEQFEEKIAAGEILEYDVYNGNYYGLGIDEVETSVMTGRVCFKDLTVKGVLNSKEILSDKHKQVNVFVTERKKVLRERLIYRGEKKENIKNRLKLYSVEQKMSRHYDYIIYNTILKDSIDQLESVVNTEYDNLPILTNVSTLRINAKRIDKVALKLRAGKVLKPIKVMEHDGRIYITEGVNTYLAGLQAGILVTKQFENKHEKLNKDINQDEWMKIVESYRK